jgi:hypothetical protein
MISLNALHRATSSCTHGIEMLAGALRRGETLTPQQLRQFEGMLAELETSQRNWREMVQANGKR